MKLKTKLVLLVFFILAVSMGACAAFSIARLKEYSLSVQVESEREKLRIAGRALSFPLKQPPISPKVK